MAIEIEYCVKHSVKNLIERAKQTGCENGVNFEGDCSSGKASRSGFISLTGHYTITGKKMGMVITDKPWIASWGLVKDEILKWLKSNDKP